MNDLQIARQIQTILRAITWSDAGLVFARESVLVTMGIREDAVREVVMPCALIRPGGFRADAEQPGVGTYEVVVSIAQVNSQDQFGETALVGANRGGGSDGRGILEVKELVLAALLQIGPASGFRIVLRSSGNAQAASIPGIGYCLEMELRFEVAGTTARTYQAPSGFARTGSGSTAVLAWNAPTRWDHRRFILRRASGSTPPATSSSGTGVTLTGTPDGAGITGVTDSPGAGTYSYALFAVYDDTDADTDGQVSAAQTLSGLVVS